MIAVTGLGVISGLGSGVDAFFGRLCEGASAIAPAIGWRGTGPMAQLPAALRPDGPQLTSALALAAVRQAVEGYPAPDTLAVIGASTSGDMRPGEAAFASDLGGETLADPLDYHWRQLCHRPTQVVCRALNTRGLRATLSTACTSGACAIGLASELVRTGQAPAAVAFGADALCQITVHGFHSLGVHAANPCRPFDRDRDGMNLGEGAGALLLEPLEAALARGARPLALIGGYGNTSDAHHLTAPDPSGHGARAAIRQALGDLPASAVGYVSAHATGTPLNDAMEAAALSTELPDAAISGIKGAVGHTLGAAGTIETVATVLALDRGRLPPNTGLRTPGFQLDLVESARDVNVDAAITVNFAFGGNNAALLVRRWTG
ncbi:MAG: beta-ketoacyl-[acyl-carrier-protein] synthase family protein [Alphaproteobacteria bacterium]|nr:beta-ketoacyl-[acyl-carrier-protein] synthase family protein [Alphaproteobacteria bacterium]